MSRLKPSDYVFYDSDYIQVTKVDQTKVFYVIVSNNDKAGRKGVFDTRFTDWYRSTTAVKLTSDRVKQLFKQKVIKYV